MEIGISSAMPTYAGGLGVLAGDALRAAADLGLPMVGVTLVHRQGYFYQKFDQEGNQQEEGVRWPVDDFVKCHRKTVSVEIEGRIVHVRVWEYQLLGHDGRKVPILLLDTDVDGNTPFDRGITNSLYGGDLHMRVCQEVVLGVGGVRALRELGYEYVDRFHMNEGHAAFLVLPLIERAIAEGAMPGDIVGKVREQCIFTTHTPVPAGHDRFPFDLVERVLGQSFTRFLRSHAEEGMLNMTHLALVFSRYVNGVAIRHGEVSRQMFPRYKIHAVTNGVHSSLWTSQPFSRLFDEYIPEWRRDAVWLRNALRIPKEKIWERHSEAKLELVEHVNRTTNAGFDRDIFTMVFARRATAYKRPLLVLQDLDRLRSIANNVGPIQLVFAGKAHPHDYAGKDILKQIIRVCTKEESQLRISFLPNYDMEVAKVLVAGGDVWLNTPRPPWEASGTSGMKAAMNGVPSLSTLDGWWIEGCIEGATGWAIGSVEDGLVSDEGYVDSLHARLLYDKLEQVILPLFYKKRDDYIEVMRHSIAINGSFFNTHRMVLQYVNEAYKLW